MKRKRKYDERMGLVYLWNGKLGWGYKHGWFARWPRLAHFIIGVWNPTACVFFRHSHLCRRAPGELPVCCDCSRKVKPKPEQERSVINEW